MAKVSNLYSGAAEAAAGIVLIIIAALGNQGLASWRDARAASSNAWISDLFTPLGLAAWRFTAPAGPNATDHWLAPAVFNVVVVALTWLCVSHAIRGNGPFGRFVGAWGATALAGGIAGLACTYLVYAGSGTAAGVAAEHTVVLGLTFGFLAGVPAALAATLTGRTTRPGAARTASGGIGPDTTIPLPSEASPLAE